VKGLAVYAPTRDDLDDIFVDPFDVDFRRMPDLLWKEIRDNSIQTWKITLPTCRLPELAQFSGQTITHQRLCAQVAAWLRSNRRGFTSAARALGYQGGIADVASRDRRIFAECGYTKVHKILEGLHAGCTMIVASYYFEPVLFRSGRLFHYERWCVELEEEKRQTVEKLSIALRYEEALARKDVL
jgi:hypothetical protein